MAEFTISPGLLEVATLGITLAKTLHNLGTTAREAGEQTDYLSKNISHHCRTLKSLSRQLQIDNPDHSAEALDVARELQEQSNAVLAEIQKLLPSARRIRDGLSITQRLVWSLRKSRVKHLVGQLEYLKSTATLLLHVLSTVPNLRKYRHSKRPSTELREQISEELTEAQNLLYERCRAQQDLPNLAADDEAEEVRTIESTSVRSPSPPNAPPDVRSSSPTPPYALQDPAPHPGNCLAEIDAYANQFDHNDSRAMIMQKTTSWLAQLYGRWTTLSTNDSATGRAPLDEEEVADLAAAVTEDSNTSQVSEDRASSSKLSGPTKTQPRNETERPPPKLRLKPFITCPACGGHGGKEGSIRICSRCNGAGVMKEMIQRGPMLQTNVTVVCYDCNGEGEVAVFRDQDRCKICMGKRTIIQQKLVSETSLNWQDLPAVEKEADTEGIPAKARWTKVNRILIDPISLELGKESFEEHGDHVIIMRVLTRDEIKILADESQVIRRAQRHIENEYYLTRSKRHAEMTAIGILCGINGMTPEIFNSILAQVVGTILGGETQMPPPIMQDSRRTISTSGPPRANVEDASSSESSEADTPGSASLPQPKVQARKLSTAETKVTDRVKQQYDEAIKDYTILYGQDPNTNYRHRAEQLKMKDDADRTNLKRLNNSFGASENHYAFRKPTPRPPPPASQFPPPPLRRQTAMNSPNTSDADSAASNGRPKPPTTASGSEKFKAFTRAPYTQWDRTTFDEAARADAARGFQSMSGPSSPLKPPKQHTPGINMQTPAKKVHSPYETVRSK